MPGLHYLTLDVFTDQPFGGNQLAVFPDAAGLETGTMQAIARELNLSETVFVVPGRGDAEWGLRIFTPGLELPFAGHPTIGAAIALAELGRVSAGHGVVFDEAAGPVEVSLALGAGHAPYAALTSPVIPRELEPPATAQDLARVIGIESRHFGPPGVSAFSASVPFTIVPVATRELLARARVDREAWREHLSASGAPHILVYTMEDWAQGSTVQMRMFAPLMGIEEDPATGAAAAALAGQLMKAQRPSDGTSRWRLYQGDDMGRPSRLALEADIEAGRLLAVRVGGHAVLMGSGSLEWVQ